MEGNGLFFNRDCFEFEDLNKGLAIQAEQEEGGAKGDL